MRRDTTWEGGVNALLGITAWTYRMEKGSLSKAVDERGVRIDQVLRVGARESFRNRFGIFGHLTLWLKRALEHRRR